MVKWHRNKFEGATMLKNLFLIFLCCCLNFLFPSAAKSQVITTEEKFQDLFISAGYGTVYGAALGAALLSFQSEPENNLKLIALGASVGFITGSLLGSYIIISPVLESKSETIYSHSLAGTDRWPLRAVGLEGSVTFLEF